MASCSYTPAPLPPWIELPSDVTENILRRLGPAEILENAQRVCTTWWSSCREPSLWRVIEMKSPSDSLKTCYEPDVVCKFAVDRSKGELIDISIEDFGDDYLLSYISDRSSHLKCLRLVNCLDISAQSLTTAVKKFRELEELHLIFMPQISAFDIEAIGNSCSKLKSFTLNSRCVKFPMEPVDDSYALKIAKSMPNLLHLRLFGNKLTDQGLEAILAGCPCLESLDLRQCFKVYLLGDLEERCVNRIKDVRWPYDSTTDYEWDSRIFLQDDDTTADSCSELDFDDNYEDFEVDYGFHENYDDYTNRFDGDFGFHDDNYDDYTNPFNGDFGFDDFP